MLVFFSTAIFFRKLAWHGVGLSLDYEGKAAVTRSLFSMAAIIIVGIFVLLDRKFNISHILVAALFALPYGYISYKI